MDVDIDLLSGAHHAEKGRPPVAAFGTPREQTRPPQLGVTLEFPFSRVVVEWQECMLDEPGEVLEVPEVVVRNLAYWVRRRQASLHHALQPLSETVEDAATSPSTEGDEVLAEKALLLSEILELVQRLEEPPALRRQVRLRLLGGLELANRMGVAVGGSSAWRSRGVAALRVAHDDAGERVQSVAKPVGMRTFSPVPSKHKYSPASS